MKPTSGVYYRGNSTLLNLAFDRLMNTRRRDTPERAQSLKRRAAPLASFKFHYSIVLSFFVKRHTFLLCRCVNSSECSGRGGQISKQASVDELTYQQHGTVDSTAVRF